jgi:CRISPR/Cas system-associated exonuclease Cas4 (RecB family)
MIVGSSDIGAFSSCARKFYYGNELGWKPKTSSYAMDIGSAFHICAAEGYRQIMHDKKNTHWLAAALIASKEPMKDRFTSRIFEFEDEELECLRDMLEYYWENVGQYDAFDEIVAVEEEWTFDLAGWIVRGTMDLVVRERGEIVIYDHKTSGDIEGDKAHLPLDLQTHLYYLCAYKRLGRPSHFVHNYQRRFDSFSDTRVGPPTWERGRSGGGVYPYRLTKSGKVATRSSDPNDYVRRVRTPLSEKQLHAFELELTNRLRTMSFHQMANIWPRNDQKLGFGCSNCAFYAPCSTEQNGGTIADFYVEQNYEVVLG